MILSDTLTVLQIGLDVPRGDSTLTPQKISSAIDESKLSNGYNWGYQIYRKNLRTTG